MITRQRWGVFNRTYGKSIEEEHLKKAVTFLYLTVSFLGRVGKVAYKSGKAVGKAVAQAAVKLWEKLQRASCEAIKMVPKMTPKMTPK